MDIQEKVRNEYTLTQDYSEGPERMRAPITPENANFPGQIEKPKKAWQEQLSDADAQSRS
jgi:NADH-quinone oxidoreductase subunit B